MFEEPEPVVPFDTVYNEMTMHDPYGPQPFWLGHPFEKEDLSKYHSNTDPHFLGHKKTPIPVRRHSLAHESLSSSSGDDSPWPRERSSSVLMDSIWSPVSPGTTLGGEHHDMKRTVSFSENSLEAYPSRSPWIPNLPVSSPSSTALPTGPGQYGSSTQRGQDPQPQHHPFGMRRFSLSPLPSSRQRNSIETDSMMHRTDLRDMLSSVPEEPASLFPCRRHSLAGPLLSSSTPRRVCDRQKNAMTSHPAYVVESATDACAVPLHPTDIRPISPSYLNPNPECVSWCMVEFKAGRAEIFYSLCSVEVDDWVIVEADRGCDLGKVVAKDLPTYQVTLLLHSTLQSNSGMIDPSDSPAPASKRICRRATPAEVTLMYTKRQDEQKALLICQSKCRQKSLFMDIVDAEYQWDRRKLTFYFVADRRVDFRELVRDLFKIYKTRIWMCSVNATGK